MDTQYADPQNAYYPPQQDPYQNVDLCNNNQQYFPGAYQDPMNFYYPTQQELYQDPDQNVDPNNANQQDVQDPFGADRQEQYQAQAIGNGGGYTVRNITVPHNKLKIKAPPQANPHFTANIAPPANIPFSCNSVMSQWVICPYCKLPRVSQVRQQANEAAAWINCFMALCSCLFGYEAPKPTGMVQIIHTCPTCHQVIGTVPLPGSQGN